MRVAFAGASGTGKTTLMRHVVKMTGFDVCPVGSRGVAKSMGFENPYDVDAAGRRDEFQKRLFAEKRDWEASHEFFVTDRSAFDNLAYSTMHGARVTTDELLEYEGAMARYTHVLYLPITAFHDVGDDPHRVKELGYHVMFDMILRALFAERFSGIPSKVWRNGLEEREKQVRGILGL